MRLYFCSNLNLIHIQNLDGIIYLWTNSYLYSQKFVFAAILVKKFDVLRFDLNITHNKLKGRKESAHN